MESHHVLLQEQIDQIRQRGPSDFMGPERYSIRLPFASPFFDDAFFNNPTINAILETVLGSDNIWIEAYETDTPMIGSIPQQWHSDLEPLFRENTGFVHPPVSLAVNFPYVDVTNENGPLEIAPGTHQLNRDQIITELHDGTRSPIPVLMNAGDVLIRDQRTIHRGTSNRTAEPRVVSVIQYNRSRYGNPFRRQQSMNDETWDGLPDRLRRQFASIRSMPWEGFPDDL